MRIYPQMGPSKENDNTFFRSFLKKTSLRNLLFVILACENVSHQRHRRASAHRREKREVEAETVAAVS